MSRPWRIGLRGELDPTPELPLTAKHEMGLVPAIERLAGDTDQALLGDRRVRRVLVFRRHVPWNRIQRLTFTNRYELVRGDGLNKLVEDITNRLAVVPIPGHKWLLRRLIGGLSIWLEQMPSATTSPSSATTSSGRADLPLSARSGEEIPPPRRTPTFGTQRTGWKAGESMYRVLGFGLVPLVVFALWLYCIFDVIASDEALVRNLPRGLWLVLVIFLPTVGSVAWLALGRPLYASWRPGDTRARPARPRTLGPEDSPDYPTRAADEREERLRAWEEDLRRREEELGPDDED